MKRFKKMMALVIATMMIFTMSSLSIFAATHTVSTESTTHTYEVYQIFTGTKSGTQLTNLKYGTNAKDGTPGESVSASDMAALATIEGKTYANDQEKITDLSAFVTLSNPVATLGKDGEASASLEEGYYVIKDKDGTLSDPETYTLYLFKVLDDNLTITPKDGTTTVDKTVTETNDATGSTTAEQKGADYDQGDSIPYSIPITLAKNVTDYKKYEVTLTDTLSDGLTPPTLSGITITIKDKSGNTIDGSSIPGYTAPAASINGQTITVTFSAGNGTTAIGTAGAALNEAIITVSYSATLNANAVVGEDGNENTYKIQYSNNPNNTNKGTTPDKEVKVYTYELEIEKVDGNSEPLQGAGFTLYKEVTNGYSDAQTGEAIKATFTTASKVNASKLDDNKYYVPVTMTEAVNGSSGKVTHKTDTKIDAGNYVLIETTVPAGYNAYAGENITLTSTIDAEGNLTGLTATPATLTVASDLSEVSGTVVNNSGSVLPSTGGIGTTMFYLVGAILIIGAGVILVTRRRIDGAQE